MPVITPQFEMYVISDGVTYAVPAVKSMRIESSRKLKADKAIVEFPRMDGLTLDTFKKNDTVNIKLGHREDSSLNTVFFGYIREISPNEPVSITCEDVWALVKERRRSSGYNFKSVLFSEIAGDLIGDIDKSEGVSILAPDTTKEMVDNFYVDKQSYEQIFNELCKASGWDFLVIPGTKQFYFGPGLYKANHLEQSDTPVFAYGLNIISSNLTWREPREIDRVRIFTADKEFKRRTGVTEPVGEYTRPGIEGEPQKVKDMFIAGVKESEGSTRAREEYDKMTADGFEGSLRTFGRSGFTHSMKCRIDGVDQRHPASHAFVEKVTYSYGADSGFKMDVYPEPSMMAGTA